MVIIAVLHSVSCSPCFIRRGAGENRFCLLSNRTMLCKNLNEQISRITDICGVGLDDKHCITKNNYNLSADWYTPLHLLSLCFYSTKYNDNTDLLAYIMLRRLEQNVIHKRLSEHWTSAKCTPDESTKHTYITGMHTNSSHTQRSEPCLLAKLTSSRSVRCISNKCGAHCTTLELHTLWAYASLIPFMGGWVGELTKLDFILNNAFLFVGEIKNTLTWYQQYFSQSYSKTFLNFSKMHNTILRLW